MLNLLLFSSLSFAALVDKPNKFPQVSNQSYGLTGFAILGESNRFNLGLEYNWDYAWKRFDYSYNIDYSQSILFGPQKWTDSYQYNAQHRLSYLLTRHINLFAQHQYESSDTHSVDQLATQEHYMPGMGVGYMVLRKPKVQWNLFAGSMMDILAYSEMSPRGQEPLSLEMEPRYFMGNSGHWMSRKERFVVQWDNWINPSMSNPNDYTLVTKVNTDIAIHNNLYFRTHAKQTYESIAHSDAGYNNQLTFGVVWNNWSSYPSKRMGRMSLI